MIQVCMSISHLVGGNAVDNGDRPHRITADMMAADLWTDEMLKEAGIPIRSVDLVSVGRGLGTFGTVEA